MITQTVMAPHFGLTVPDLEAAIHWYVSILGFRLLTGPLEVSEQDSDLGKAAQAIYGKGFEQFRFAHLATPDNIGLELFQFKATPSQPNENNFQFWLGGYNHMGLTAVNVAEAVAGVVAAGGKDRSGVLLINPQKGYEIAYCQDPWGTIIEFCSHPYVSMWEQAGDGAPKS
ncbi:Catechol 2,3-dioxygenase [Pseudomonas gessardii]|uniref:VOC family protein n=1 Tax=Pseudomonas TaxID=286 RepID=UPI00088D8642|nr:MULTISPECIES: VOC family protein [Pseudomonas]MRU53503.1 glyoxalase [Pseudomonas gessardii]SDQ42224.1 Catechol 2,3-dioxygenase [Pseudomonas gessardii]